MSSRSIVCSIKFSLSIKNKQTKVQIIRQWLLKTGRVGIEGIKFVFLTKVGILVHLNCRFLLFVGGEFRPNINNCYNETINYNKLLGVQQWGTAKQVAQWLSIAIFASEKSVRLNAWTYHAPVWDGPVFLMTTIVNYGQEWWYRAIVM